MSQEGCYYVLRVGRAGAPRRRGGRAEPRDFAAWAGRGVGLSTNHYRGPHLNYFFPTLYVFAIPKLSTSFAF